VGEGGRDFFFPFMIIIYLFIYFCFHFDFFKLLPFFHDYFFFFCFHFDFFSFFLSFMILKIYCFHFNCFSCCYLNNIFSP
jgi:hypothetical protein